MTVIKRTRSCPGNFNPMKKSESKTRNLSRIVSIQQRSVSCMYIHVASNYVLYGLLFPETKNRTVYNIATLKSLGPADNVNFFLCNFAKEHFWVNRRTRFHQRFHLILTWSTFYLQYWSF